MCRLFAGGTPVLRATLSPRETAALAVLHRAVKPAALDQRYALCPYCGQHHGLVVRDPAGAASAHRCECPECGPVPVEADDLAAVALDLGWLTRGLRTALAIASRDEVVPLADGVWRLGESRQSPVLLARRIDLLWRQPYLLTRVRTRGPGRVRAVTPRPAGGTQGPPFEHGVEWLALEERFTLYGGRIGFIEPAPAGDGVADAPDSTAPVHGPFSADFRWVHLDNEPVHLSVAQAAVFQALWSLGGAQRNAEAVMTRARLRSAKPSDLFKVKAKNKGDPAYEGPLRAYQTLVSTNRRAGLYWLPCAAAGHGPLQ